MPTKRKTPAPGPTPLADRRDRSRLRTVVQLARQLFPNKKAFIDSGARCSTRHVTDFEQYLHDLSHENWKLERASAGPKRRRAAPGSVNMPVAVHVINKGTGIANGDVPQIADRCADQCPERGLRGHRLAVHLHARERQPHHQRHLVHDDPGLAAEAKPRTRCASADRARSTSTSPTSARACSAGRPSRRTTPPTRRSTASSSSTPRCPAAAPRPTTWATPPPTRSATGSACTTRSRAAAPEERPGRGHAGREVGGVRLPDRPRHLPRRAPAGPRPDHQLHGLHRRRLHEHLHRRPGVAHGQPAPAVPTHAVTEAATISRSSPRSIQVFETA